MALLDKLKIGGIIYDAWATKDQIGSASDSSSATTVFGKIKAVIDYLVGIVTTAPYAKEATVSAAKESAEQVKDFFGIVKDGDTVKVVTEDGGEEIVEPVGLMDEDDVYDYLEDIAVLLGGITAQQAASITAATRAIIHGGSGSCEGGEGGSGSGSGE